MQQNDDENVENFENNLKLSYDAIRKDYDIILTSIIPTQKNLMKTYLWLNSFILGICFIFAKDNFLITPALFFLALTALFCTISMGLILYALYSNREKKFIFFCAI